MQRIKSLQDTIKGLEEDKTTLTQEKGNLETLLAIEKENTRKKEKQHEKKLNSLRKNSI